MPKLTGQVRIVGAGLLGTSIGLALSKLGIDVIVTSATRASTALAIDMGAGREANSQDEPQLIVVCVPPDNTAELVARELQDFPAAVVTDVASVKSSIISQLQELGADLARFVGSHPMAGRERGGAASGRADLFIGRPWVVVPTGQSTETAVTLVTDLAHDLTAVPITMEAVEHDHAVALVSHVPQLVSSLLASTLTEARNEDLALAGQGLRDTTRIASSDPKLWLQILSANAEQIVPVLKQVQGDLARVIDAMTDLSASGAMTTVANAMQKGNEGVSRIPGKHGGSAKHYAVVTVMIDDRPGQLGRLFAEVGQIGVNLEDLKLEHSPGAPVGLVELAVLPAAETKLVEGLRELGWRIL